MELRKIRANEIQVLQDFLYEAICSGSCARNAEISASVQDMPAAEMLRGMLRIIPIWAIREKI